MATEAELDLDARGSTTSLTGRSYHTASCCRQSGIGDIRGTWFIVPPRFATANKASTITTCDDTSTPKYNRYVYYD